MPYVLAVKQIQQQSRCLAEQERTERQTDKEGTVPNGSIGDVQDQILGTGADANFWAPDAQA